MGALKIERQRARRARMTPEQKQLERARENEARRQRIAANRDVYNAKKRAQYAARPAATIASTRQYMWRYGLRRRFGISLADWQARFRAQGEACACCGTDEPGSSRWHTDHDHATGAIRGIVCRRCNTLLGMLGDNASGVRAAAAMFLRYLGVEPS